MPLVDIPGVGVVEFAETLTPQQLRVAAKEVHDSVKLSSSMEQAGFTPPSQGEEFLARRPGVLGALSSQPAARVRETPAGIAMETVAGGSIPAVARGLKAINLAAVSPLAGSLAGRGLASVGRVVERLPVPQAAAPAGMTRWLKSLAVNPNRGGRLGGRQAPLERAVSELQTLKANLTPARELPPLAPGLPRAGLDPRLANLATDESGEALTALVREMSAPKAALTRPDLKRLVLLPEEAAQARTMAGLAAQEASKQGMRYAAYGKAGHPGVPASLEGTRAAIADALRRGQVKRAKTLLRMVPSHRAAS